MRITKALSIVCNADEHEEEGEREIVHYGGRNFRVAIVKGELRAENHRSTAASMLIKRRFSGELLEADQDPATNLLEEGVYSINQRRELAWELDLQPGESTVLIYKYKVLVYH